MVSLAVMVDPPPPYTQLFVIFSGVRKKHLSFYGQPKRPFFNFPYLCFF